MDLLIEHAFTSCTYTRLKSDANASVWRLTGADSEHDSLLCRSMEPALNPSPDHGRDLVLVFKFGVLRYKYERGAVYLLRYL